MRTFIIIVSIVWVSFFILAKIYYKSKKKESNKKRSKPSFRSEEDLDEYAKPMKDDHQSTVDFEDAE